MKGGCFEERKHARRQKHKEKKRHQIPEGDTAEHLE